MSQVWSVLSNSRYKAFELPGAKPQYNPDRPGQVEHIALDLVLDIPNERASGSCTMRICPVRDGITSITMDAVALEIKAVTIASVPQPYSYDGHRLTVQLLQQTVRGVRLELAIDYGIDQPDRGMYFVKPTEHYPDKPVQVWTQGEDEDSRYWFPCFDYPGQLATSEIRVTVPGTFSAVSNGVLASVEDLGSSKIYHWQQNQVHPSYLMTLAVAEYVELRDEWRGKPITYYVTPGLEDRARLTMGKTPRMVEFFSKTYRYDYAYDKYAQVCADDFIFGGMENTSTTLLTTRCLLDERAAIDNLSSETLVAHELAHQWFGDLAVIKHWSHAWVKEGAASYAEVLWLEHEYGEDLAHYYLLGQAEEYQSEDSGRYRRPLVTNVYRDAIELYDRHIYEKGSCVYHMVRAELGDDLFQESMGQFLRNHAHSVVETVDLLRAVEQATGKNLAPMFDQYVYRGGHPDYKVAYSWDDDSKLAKLTVTQTQAESEKDCFDLKLPIAFGSNKAITQTLTVRIHEKEQSFYFPLAEKPEFVSFDRGNYTLKSVALEYPVPELKAQLLGDPEAVSRVHAARALGKKGGLEAVKALQEALENDKFWGVRLEAAQALSKVKLDQAFDALLLGLKDPEARVRRVTIESLTRFKTRASYEAVRSIALAGDASYLVEAAALRNLGTFAASGLPEAPAESEVLGILSEALEKRSSWNEVLRIGAIGALSRMKTSAAALDLLMQYTEIGVAQPLRLSAVRSLGAISTGQEKPNLERILNRLRELSRERFFLSQVAAIVALEGMETPKAIALLQGFTGDGADGRTRRMAEEAIAMVQSRSGSTAAVNQLRQEFDSMKEENRSLLSRLEVLEAKGKKES
jgi:aminopeptidase N